ncbi:hypothetical protein BHM03_00037864 [Ensete ventricosum]|uniref:Uncharacterized protein n=1 Tax=Ensete ventricosum TaxID=4639 RepID=A0A445MJQ1_ENSVE|nr:hypothetical protein BHM03_00037864 [Ensete ventricosum]
MVTRWITHSSLHSLSPPTHLPRLLLLDGSPPSRLLHRPPLPRGLRVGRTVPRGRSHHLRRCPRQVGHTGTRQSSHQAHHPSPRCRAHQGSHHPRHGSRGRSHHRAPRHGSHHTRPRRGPRQGALGGNPDLDAAVAGAGDVPARTAADYVATSRGFPHPIDPGPGRGAAEGRGDARPNAEQEEEEEDEEARRCPRSGPSGSGRRVTG